ncbi:heme o synthase [Thiohalorhabdus denitrificans]|uniref:Protoheme IX farnesyltransferase n=1 Tax=Thiohalorhabdus denitrificans TaxID=381306 RepID=A0A1G5EGS6_9GAMM|nr:heme o synthase [Thiohalorhabdus denitrificans]SCY26157.1 protoheme IX farnesyltransferase [Thiohalorhabdus denitrificans]
MPQAPTKMALVGGQVRAHWRDYYELCKPRGGALIVFTAMVGMFLASPGAVPLGAFLFGTLGIALCAASGAAINHVVDEEVDARMARTKRRPLPTGHLNRAGALGFAFALGLAGMALLIWLVNPLTAWLTFASLVGYAVVYTVFLKRATPQNIVIGGAAGAAPPVLGWVAVTGEVQPHALLLFLIIFAWTPPHFWALAIARYRDYAEAEIPMLPVTHGVALTRLHLLLYTVLLVLVSLLPFATGMSGWIYLVGAMGLGAGFLGQALALLVTGDDARYAMPTFGYSIFYLMALFAVLFVDAYLPLLGGLLA